MYCFCYKMITERTLMKREDTKQLFVQFEQALCEANAISSPKSEPFKQWLAQVGAERLDEIADPEKAIVRGADFYRAKGYSEKTENRKIYVLRSKLSTAKK